MIKPRCVYCAVYDLPERNNQLSRCLDHLKLASRDRPDFFINMEAQPHSCPMFRINSQRYLTWALEDSQGPEDADEV